MTSPKWEPDELEGFEKLTLELDPEGDGPLAATLVRKAVTPRPEVAVLYLHGFTDYFFQAHVAGAFVDAGLDFYALDLRRYGRSIRPGNRPTECRRVDDYFHEMTWAIDHLSASHSSVRCLLAHSTGGLVAALYLARGARRKLVESAILNNPFLAFRANAFENLALAPVVALGKKFPRAPAPVGLNRVYGQTLHVSESGEWNYDLSKKPLAGFGVTCGWIRAIDQAQQEAQAGLAIECPILLQHSERWHRPGRVVAPEDHREDIVLSSDDSRKYGPRLGPNVRLESVKDGIHDLTLSRKDVRERVIERQISFAKCLV